MRSALNENPVVQMAVIGVVAIIFAVLMFTTILKGEEEVPAVDPNAAVEAPAAGSDTGAAPTTDPATATPAADPAAAPATTDPAAAAPSGAAPAPDPSAAAAADGLLPTKGLPKDVLIAFAKDKAIVLLVVDPKAITDRVVRGYTEALSSRGGVEVFVVDVKDVAKYSRITSGVAVSRAPALVVIRPRKLTNNVPTATVSYGFRSERSVRQAVDDALFDGKNAPAYP